MAGTALAEDTNHPNTVGWSFAATVPYPSLISRITLGDSEPDCEPRPEAETPAIRRTVVIVAGRVKDSLSLLLLLVALAVVILWYILTLRAPTVVPVLNVVDLSVITSVLHCGLGLIGISTASSKTP